MIRLNKQPQPTVLEQNATTWRDEYLAALNNHQTPTHAQKFRYRHPDIKTALRIETAEKCAYCESKVSAVHPGEIDHILPIAHKPELIVEWTNLTYVCTECNRRKSDYFSDEEPLVNPYLDEPTDHLTFWGPIVLHKDSKGYRTTRKLELSRTALFERKQERIEQLCHLIQQWRSAPNGPTRDFIREEIINYTTAEAEFAATIRLYLSVELGWDEFAPEFNAEAV